MPLIEIGVVVIAGIVSLPLTLIVASSYTRRKIAKKVASRKKCFIVRCLII